MVDYRITADERARFKRCRRQWDFSSPHRRNLQPAVAVESALRVALRDALDVYYYPGTWDWQHEVTQPLVHKALKRSLDDAGASALLDQGVALLDCYDAWASGVDDFAPVKINTEVEAIVPDPGEPERGLVVHDGSPVIYPCRIDLVAVDAADDYWVVRHQIVDAWQELETLIRDEEAVAACWAFEQDYLGIEIAGTIHNELRIDGPLDFPSAGRTTNRMPKGVAQHEPSGGGRSTPQHRRVAAQVARAGNLNRTEQRTAGVLRRTRIRRSRHEITANSTPLSGPHRGRRPGAGPGGGLSAATRYHIQTATGSVHLGLWPGCRAAAAVIKQARRATYPGRCRAPGPSV